MTTIDRDQLRAMATETGRGYVRLTGPTLTALLDALDREEARSNIRHNQTLYWQGETRIAQARSARAEDRIRAARDLLDQVDEDNTRTRHPTPHGGGLGPALIDTDTVRRALNGECRM